jgi:hypothetical protein
MTYSVSVLFQLFTFADKYRGKYDASITVARNYYGSFSGYGVSSSHHTGRRKTSL